MQTVGASDEYIGNHQSDSPSLATINRLPKYLSLADRLYAENVEWVRSRLIAEELGLVSATVRRDFLYLDCYGLPNRGYLVTELRASLIESLGLSRPQNLVVIGAGNLGRAVAAHLITRSREFTVSGVYDIAPEVIGISIGKIIVRPMDKLADDVKKEAITLAALTVHEKAAQSAADHLVSLGLRGILNLSSGTVRVEDNTALVNTQIVNDLRLLSSIKRKIEQDGQNPDN